MKNKLFLAGVITGGIAMVSFIILVVCKHQKKKKLNVFQNHLDEILNNEQPEFIVDPREI